jgi:hypothetical protein
MDGTIRRLIAGEMLWKELQAWYNKLNPIWWFLNDDEPYPPAWYLPGKPSWLRFPAWYIRNPMSNFADYVIGVWCLRSQLHCHRHCALYATTWNNLPNPLPLGFKWSVIHTAIPLPFVSYTGKRVLWVRRMAENWELRAQVQSAEQRGPSRLVARFN